MILFDVSPIPGGAAFGIGLAAVLFLAFAIIAFIAFKMLQKTVKMAIRLVIVGVILLIAVVGGTALIFISSTSKSEKPPIKTTR